MTEYYGKDLSFTFTGTSGTVDMSEYSRGVTFSPTVQLDEVTTGSAADKTSMTGLKDFTVSFKGLAQTTGTALENTLVIGAIGTVVFTPEGTPSGTVVYGHRQYTLPVISQGCQLNLQYNALTEINVSFVGNGTALYGSC